MLSMNPDKDQVDRPPYSSNYSVSTSNLYDVLKHNTGSLQPQQFHNDEETGGDVSFQDAFESRILEDTSAGFGNDHQHQQHHHHHLQQRRLSSGTYSDTSDISDSQKQHRHLHNRTASNETSSSRSPFISSSAESRSPSNFISRDRVSGGKSLGLIKREKIMDELKKDNFDLKLRIYFLEERLEKYAPNYQDRLSEETEELKHALESMSSDVVSSREEAARATNRIMELQQNYYQVSVENEQLKQEEFNLREHLREAQEILEALQSQTVSKADKVNLEATVSQLQNNLNKSQCVESDLKEQLDRLAKDNDLLGQQNTSLSTKMESMVQQMEKIEQEQVTRGHIQSLLDQNVKSIGNLDSEFNAIQVGFSSVSSAKEGIQERVDGVTSRIQQLFSQVSLQSGSIKENSKNYLHMLDILESLKTELQGIHSEKSEAEKQYSLLAHTFSLQAQMCEDRALASEKRLNQLQEKMQEDHMLRDFDIDHMVDLYIQERNGKQEMSTRVHQLEAELQKVKADMDNNLNMLSKERSDAGVYRDQISALESQIQTHQTSLGTAQEEYQQFKKSSGEELIVLKLELSTLASNKKTFEQEALALRSELEACQAEIKERDNRIEDIKATKQQEISLKQIQIDNLILQQESIVKNVKQRSVEDIQKAQLDHAEVLETLTEELHSITREKEMLDAKLMEKMELFDKELKQKSDELTARGNSNDELKNANEVLQKALAESRIVYNELSTQLDASKAELAGMIHEKQTLENKVSDQSRQHSDLLSSLDAIKLENSKKVNELEQLKLQLACERDGLKRSLSDLKSSQSQEQQDHANRALALTTQCDDLSTRLHESEAQIVDEREQSKRLMAVLEASQSQEQQGYVKQISDLEAKCTELSTCLQQSHTESSVLVNSLEAQLENEKGKVEQVLAKLSRVEQDYAKQTKALESRYTDMENALHERVKENDAIILSKTEELNVALGLLKSTKMTLFDLQNQLANERSSRIRDSDEESRLKQELKNLQEEVRSKSLEIDKSACIISLLQTDLSAMEEASRSYNETLAELRNVQIKDRDVLINNMKRLAEGNRTTIEDLEARCSQLNEEIDQLKSNASSLSLASIERDGLLLKIQSGANQIADLNKSLEHLEKIKQGLVADLEFERTANATALALESTLKMEIQMIRSDLNNKDAEIDNLETIIKSNQLKYEKEFETMQAALDDAVQRVCDSEASHKEDMMKLNSEYNENMHDNERESKQSVLTAQMEMSALENQLIDANDKIAELQTSFNRKSKALEERIQDHVIKEESLQKEIQLLTSDRNAVSDELRQAVAKMEDLQLQLRLKGDELEKATQMVKTKNKLASQVNILELGKLKAEKTIMQLNQDINEKSSELEPLKEIVSVLREEIANKEVSTSKASRELEKAKKSIVALEEELLSSKNALEETRQYLRSSTDKIALLESQLQNSENVSFSVRESEMKHVAVLQTALDEMKNDRDVILNKLKLLQNDVSTKEEKSRRQEELVQDLQNDLRIQLSKIKDLTLLLEESRLAAKHQFKEFEKDKQNIDFLAKEVEREMDEKLLLRQELDERDALISHLKTIIEKKEVETRSLRERTSHLLHELKEKDSSLIEIKTYLEQITGASAEEYSENMQARPIHEQVMILIKSVGKLRDAFESRVADIDMKFSKEKSRWERKFQQFVDVCKRWDSDLKSAKISLKSLMNAKSRLKKDVEALKNSLAIKEEVVRAQAEELEQLMGENRITAAALENVSFTEMNLASLKNKNNDLEMQVGLLRDELRVDKECANQRVMELINENKQLLQKIDISKRKTKYLEEAMKTSAGNVKIHTSNEHQPDSIVKLNEQLRRHISEKDSIIENLEKRNKHIMDQREQLNNECTSLKRKSTRVKKLARFIDEAIIHLQDLNSRVPSINDQLLNDKIKSHFNDLMSELN